MTYRLNTRDADFEPSFQAFLSSKREVSEDVNTTVAAIIKDVRTRGDAAVIDLTSKFDRQDLTTETLHFTHTEIDAALAQCDAETVDALKLAAARIDRKSTRLNSSH